MIDKGLFLGSNASNMPKRTRDEDATKKPRKPSKKRIKLKPLDQVRAFAEGATAEELAQVFEADFWSPNHGPDRPVLDGGSQKTGFRSWMLRNPQVTDTDERIEMRRKAYAADLVAMLNRKPLLQKALLELSLVQARLEQRGFEAWARVI
jgi:hypothetical protein